MILLLHILMALSSIAYTTFTYFTPSKNKLRVAYSLVAGTLLSGMYLVISTHGPLLQSCVTGLVYLLVVSAGIAAARQKFKQLDKFS